MSDISVYRLLLLAGLSVLTAAPAAAGPAAELALLAARAETVVPEAGTPAAEDPGKVYYIAPWEVDTSVVPPAPAPGAAADLRDLAELRRWQAERTPEQCAAARLQEDAGYEVFFGAVSPLPRPLPEPAEKIFKRVKIDAASVVWLLKEKYERPRPYLRDSSLAPCVEREGSTAYPSGHSAVARVYALMLEELDPAGAQAYRAAAAQAALNRVIGGVHHPSDTAAGLRLGDAVYAALKKDREFREDVELLRRALRR